MEESFIGIPISLNEKQINCLYELYNSTNNKYTKKLNDIIRILFSMYSDKIDHLNNILEDKQTLTKFEKLEAKISKANP